MRGMVHNSDCLRAVVLVLVCLVAASNAFPQSTQDKIKSEPQQASPDLREIIRVHSDLIILSVTVRDRNGNLVSGLRQEDFHVFDEGWSKELPRSTMKGFRSPW